MVLESSLTQRPSPHLPVSLEAPAFQGNNDFFFPSVGVEPQFRTELI